MLSESRLNVFRIRQDVSSIVEFIVGKVGIFILTFLLKVRQIRIIVQGLIEVMNILISHSLLRIFKHLVIVIQAKLCFPIVDLE